VGISSNLIPDTICFDKGSLESIFRSYKSVLSGYRLALLMHVVSKTTPNNPRYFLTFSYRTHLIQTHTKYHWF